MCIFYKYLFENRCNVQRDWFVFLHRTLLVNLLNSICSSSKCRYVFSISKYYKFKSYKLGTTLEQVAAASLKVSLRHVYECILYLTVLSTKYNN